MDSQIGRPASQICQISGAAHATSPWASPDRSNSQRFSSSFPLSSCEHGASSANSHGKAGLSRGVALPESSVIWISKAAPRIIFGVPHLSAGAQVGPGSFSRTDRSAALVDAAW